MNNALQTIMLLLHFLTHAIGAVVVSCHLELDMSCHGG